MAVKKKAKRKAKVSKLPLRRKAKAKTKAKALPKGKLEVFVTYLEMTRPPKTRKLPHRGERLAVMRAEQPTLAYYRFLYNTVGEQWMWYERRALKDKVLIQTINDPKVDINVLYVAGVPAGFAELDARNPEDVELAYFGLMPEFIGRGLGHYFLSWAIDKAWGMRPSRVWVNTCNFDHPAAIAVYQRAGFVPYDQEIKIINDPRKSKLFV